MAELNHDMFSPALATAQTRGAQPLREADSKSRSRSAALQLAYLVADLRAQVNHRWWRWVTIWLFFGSAPEIVTYRLNRVLYILFSRAYVTLGILLWPLFLLLRILGPLLEIKPQADIGPGLRILHPNLGVMVSTRTRAGQGLTLAGDNWITVAHPHVPGWIELGDEVVLHGNAILLGPAEVGDGCVFGAGAVAIGKCVGGRTYVGVPARPVKGKASR